MALGVTRGLVLTSCLVACAAQSPAPPAPTVHLAAPPAPAPAASRSSESEPPSSEPDETTQRWFASRGGEECATDGSGEPCRDGLKCFPRESTSSTNGVCAVPATVDELLDQRHLYLGRLVGLRHAQVGHLTSCTHLGCGAQNPCCNNCSKRPYLEAKGSGFHLGLADENGKRYLEQADECEIKKRWSLSSRPHVIIGRLILNGADLSIQYMVPEGP